MEDVNRHVLQREGRKVGHWHLQSDTQAFFDTIWRTHGVGGALILH